MFTAVGVGYSMVWTTEDFVRILCTAAIQAFRYLLYSTSFPHGVTAPSVPGPLHGWGFMITLRHTTFGRNPLDGWSARRINLYLATHNSHTRRTSMPAAAFEPAIPVSERPQIQTFDHAATGIGLLYSPSFQKNMFATTRRCLVVAASAIVRVAHVRYTHGTV